MKLQCDWNDAFQQARRGKTSFIEKKMDHVYHNVLYPQIFNLCKSSDLAYDICSIAITKFWEKFYVKEHELPKDVDSYLFIMTRNAYRQYHKMESKRNDIITSLDEDRLKMALENTGRGDYDSNMEYDEKELYYRALENAFNKMGEKCKEILKRNIIEKQKIRSLALEMGFSTENAASQKKISCVKKLKKLVFIELSQLKCESADKYGNK